MQDSKPPPRQTTYASISHQNTQGSGVKLADMAPERAVAFLLALKWTKTHQINNLTSDCCFLKLSPTQLGATINENGQVVSAIISEIYQKLGSLANECPNPAKAPHPMDVEVDFLSGTGLQDDGMIQIMMPRKTLSILRMCYGVNAPETQIKR